MILRLTRMARSKQIRALLSNTTDALLILVLRGGVAPGHIILKVCAMDGKLLPSLLRGACGATPHGGVRALHCPGHFKDTMSQAACYIEYSLRGQLCTPSGAKVLVHPDQYRQVMLSINDLVLDPRDIIVSESLEYLVEEIICSMPCRSRGRIRTRSLLGEKKSVFVES